jgi:hypothetical protein
MFDSGVKDTPQILRLPYDASLTVAGIEYAKKSLHYTYNRMHLAPAARLRKIVAGVAVELALRRWLQAHSVPFDLLGATHFTEKDKYDLRLGGRRCDVKSFLISDRKQIATLRRDPAWLNAAEALVPEDQFQSDRMEEQDIYLFGFLAGLETRSAQDLAHALRAEQPVYLIHTLSQPKWRGAHNAPGLAPAPGSTWRSLGRLLFKADTRGPIELEAGGQAGNHAGRVEQVRLEPGVRAASTAEFYSLLYLHVPRLPDGPVGVRSPVLRETVIVEPGDWVNIWVYGIEVFLAGWLPKADFRALSRRLPRGASVLQYPRTQTDNRAVPVTQLRPVGELADLVKRWG